MKVFLFLAFFCSAVHAEDVVVFAASSLTDVLSRLAKVYENDTKTKIKLSFDASSRLAFQIEQGAKAEIFFSADKEWNKSLAAKGFTSEEMTRDLLSNDLVMITHKNQKYILSNLKSLKTMKFKHLALAHENVPAGKYALEALKKNQLQEMIKHKIVSADHVRNVLTWVAKDEADLGIVFASDAKTSSEVKVLLKIPTDEHSLIIYPVSVIGKKPTPEALKFFSFLQTEKSKNAFIEAGFKSVGK